VIISVISIAAMLVLIHYKKKIGAALNSKAIIADANCNVVCVYMSLTLLASSFLYECSRFRMSMLRGHSDSFIFPSRKDVNALTKHER
jgi:hypothetical protein